MSVLRSVRATDRALGLGPLVVRVGGQRLVRVDGRLRGIDAPRSPLLVALEPQQRLDARVLPALHHRLLVLYPPGLVPRRGVARVFGYHHRLRGTQGRKLLVALRE